MPDLEERLRFLERLSSHQTFTLSTADSREKKHSFAATTPSFNETGRHGSLASFIRNDTNFPAQRKLILHQESLQQQATCKHLQGIDGFEGRDVLCTGEDDDSLARVLRWPQYTNPRLQSLLQRHQNTLLASNQPKKTRTSFTAPIWSTLFPAKPGSRSNKTRQPKADSSCKWISFSILRT